MKGQAGIEYLTTYIWAFFAILVIAAGVAYYLFSVDTAGPQVCNFGAQLVCEDFIVSESHTFITVKNMFGFPIQLQDVTSPQVVCSFANPDIAMQRRRLIECTQTFAAGSDVTLDFLVKFKRNATGAPDHNLTGTITTKVLEGALDCVDFDLDGYNDDSAALCPGRDCNDNDRTIYPHAPEDCSDGVDSDCDGEDC